MIASLLQCSHSSSQTTLSCPFMYNMEHSATLFRIKEASRSKPNLKWAEQKKAQICLFPNKRAKRFLMAASTTTSVQSNKFNFTDTGSPHHETCLHPLSDSIAKTIVIALKRIRRRKRSEQTLPCYKKQRRGALLSQRKLSSDGIGS